MKLDTTKQGINAIWKKYEAESIRFLLDAGEEGSGSGAVFDHVLFVLSAIGESISRASIIFFLNRLVDDGLATFITRTGKGGHRRVYSLIERTWDDFNATVIDKFLYKLWEIFPANDRTKNFFEGDV